MSLPSTPEGLLLVIGAIFLSIGILGGGFELSAIKIPAVGKYPRIFAFITGIIFIFIAIKPTFMQLIMSQSINSSLVNETSWHVATFEQGNVGDYHPVPWVFHPDKTVNAGNLWAGVWTEVGTDRIKIEIKATSDTFDVIFVSGRWFVAVKNGDLYRLGKLQ
jgi:hypothetical protein